jgi:hypothetical protein
MLVIIKTVAGKKRANVCIFLGLAPTTVLTIMLMFIVPSAWHQLFYQQLWRTLKKTKSSAHKTTKLCASSVSYTRNFNTEEMEQLLMLWVDDFNKKITDLAQRAITAKSRALFVEIQQTAVGNKTFAASKGSNNDKKFNSL